MWLWDRRTYTDRFVSDIVIIISHSARCRRHYNEDSIKIPDTVITYFIEYQNTKYHLPINALFWGYYALIVLLPETMYFSKQHYESIVPEKSGILKYVKCITFPANIALWRQFTVDAMGLTSYLMARDITAIVPNNSDRALLRHQTVLLQSPNIVNQWISKDLSCDALNFYSVISIVYFPHCALYWETRKA